MGEIGTFGEKLLQAFGFVGRHGRQARLHKITEDLLRRGYAGEALTRALVEATDDDPALMIEVLDEIGFRRALLKRYGERYAARLRAQGVRLAPQHETGGNAAQGGGHRNCESQRAAAPTQPNGTGANGAQGDARGQGGNDSQSISAPASPTDSGAKPERAGTGHSVDDRQLEIARPAPTKRTPDRMAAASRALLDTVTQFGRLRDLTREQLETLARQHREKAGWYSSLAHSLPPGGAVGEYYTEADVQRLQAKTREAAHAGG